MKVAIVHDWLVSYRGGEKVLEILCELYPDAPIYTLFYDRQALPSFFQKRVIRYPKWLSKFSSIRKALLPFYPFIIESFELNEFDVIISSSSCVAKGVIPHPNAKHLCYLHSPMRYIWDQRNMYKTGIAKISIISGLIDLLSTCLRLWDSLSAQRIDTIIANSTFVKKRVEKYYRRDSQVIFPPVAIERFPVASENRAREFFLVAGAMVPYKRFDLAIEACEKAGLNLIVAGDGPEFARLAKLAGPHTKLVKNPSDAKLLELFGRAKALIFPGVEDFGIIAIEAMACGVPVIAYDAGGAKDFVIEGKTGTFFKEQEVNCLATTLSNFNHKLYDSIYLREFANKFSIERFKTEFKDAVSQMLGERV